MLDGTFEAPVAKAGSPGAPISCQFSGAAMLSAFVAWSAFVALPALVALSALAACVALSALPAWAALSALVAEPTFGSVARLMSAPLSEPFLTFAPVTALFLIFTF